MTDQEIANVIVEIKREQHPQEDDTTLTGYINDAEYDINQSAGVEIDYTSDLKARKLLKNFVLYDRYKRLAEFKILYGGEYAELQAKYYKTSGV